jgi:hypothetical protein
MSIPQMDSIKRSVDNGVNSADINSIIDALTLDSVKKAVDSLNSDKSDGDVGYNSCHLLYASDLFYEQLCYLLRAIYVHGHQPEALLVATIISIPKDSKGDMCSDSNYRGIALCCSFGKVLDKLFLWKNSKELVTSDLQFAYKAKHSTSMCTLMVKEVIRYYLERHTDVYACFIDASKAFDLVQHDKLFEILIERRIPSCDIRMLLDLYNRQQIRTSWMGCYSKSFPARNGIRQGGIASPILFCCYLDKLIEKLQLNGTGCWIGDHFLGSLAYADDLTILSPTAKGLQEQLAICEQYGAEYGMTYNPVKSNCVLFSKKKKTPPNLTLNGSVLQWSDNIKHLGNMLTWNLSEAKDVQIKRGELAGKTNSIIGNLNNLSSQILITVFRSKCCHYYGCQTWLFSQTVRDYNAMWNRCIRRVLNLPTTTHCKFLPQLTGIVYPQDQICRTFLKMIRTMNSSDNSIVKFFVARSLIDKRTVISSNLQYIETNYDVNIDSSLTMPSLNFFHIQVMNFPPLVP